MTSIQTVLKYDKIKNGLFYFYYKDKIEFFFFKFDKFIFLSTSITKAYKKMTAFPV